MFRDVCKKHSPQYSHVMVPEMCWLSPEIKTCGLCWETFFVFDYVWAGSGCVKSHWINLWDQNYNISHKNMYIWAYRYLCSTFFGGVKERTWDYLPYTWWHWQLDLTVTPPSCASHPLVSPHLSQNSIKSPVPPDIQSFDDFLCALTLAALCSAWTKTFYCMEYGITLG